MSQSCRHHLPCNCRRNASQVIVNMVQSRVKPHIESCIQKYMSLEETMTYLQNRHQIDPQITKTVWEQLERENSDFFKAYYLRCETLSQTRTFNRLLEQQATLMLEHGLFDLTNLPPAIVNLVSQNPELQTRLMGRQANPPSHRSDVSPRSLPLPELDLNYPIDLLEFPNEQQPESSPLPDLNDPIDIGVPTIAEAATAAQGPSTSQITEEASIDCEIEETPTGNTTEEGSTDSKMKKPATS